MKKGMLVTKQLLVAIDFNSMKKNTIKVIGDGGWVNDDRILFFGWTVPLRNTNIICSHNFYIIELSCFEVTKLSKFKVVPWELFHFIYIFSHITELYASASKQIVNEL